MEYQGIVAKSIYVEHVEEEEHANPVEAVQVGSLVEITLKDVTVLTPLNKQ